MNIKQRLGGINHRFTGKTKVQGYVMADPISQRYLYQAVRFNKKLRKKELEIWVEVAYQRQDWQKRDVIAYLPEEKIWIPKQLLSAEDLALFENRKVAA